MPRSRCRPSRGLFRGTGSPFRPGRRDVRGPEWRRVFDALLCRRLAALGKQPFDLTCRKPSAIGPFADGHVGRDEFRIGQFLELRGGERAGLLAQHFAVPAGVGRLCFRRARLGRGSPLRAGRSVGRSRFPGGSGRWRRALDWSAGVRPGSLAKQALHVARREPLAVHSPANRDLGSEESRHRQLPKLRCRDGPDLPAHHLVIPPDSHRQPAGAIASSVLATQERLPVYPQGLLKESPGVGVGGSTCRLKRGLQWRNRSQGGDWLIFRPGYPLGAGRRMCLSPCTDTDWQLDDGRG